MPLPLTNISVILISVSFWPKFAKHRQERPPSNPVLGQSKLFGGECQQTCPGSSMGRISHFRDRKQYKPTSDITTQRKFCRAFLPSNRRKCQHILVWPKGFRGLLLLSFAVQKCRHNLVQFWALREQYCKNEHNNFPPRRPTPLPDQSKMVTLSFGKKF
jgi:hypothetical protein